MKRAFIAAITIVGIIALRMILSLSLSEQAAEIFCRVSLSFLFFYYICTLPRARKHDVQ